MDSFRPKASAKSLTLTAFPCPLRGSVSSSTVEVMIILIIIMIILIMIIIIMNIVMIM